MKSMKLRIVTPVGELYNDNANMVIMKGIEADFAVLSGHQPLATILDYGVLKIKTDNKELSSTIFGGFVSVTKESVTILTDAGEWIDDIDIERAKKAKQRAEERLKDKANIDVLRAELALKRASIRLASKNVK